MFTLIEVPSLLAPESTPGTSLKISPGEEGWMRSICSRLMKASEPGLVNGASSASLRRPSSSPSAP